MNLNMEQWEKFKISDIFYPFINGKGITEQEIKDNRSQEHTTEHHSHLRI